MNSKFTYGDAVIIKQNAPPSLHPGRWASMCSLDQVTSHQEAEALKCEVGEWVYTVEFEDGSDIQIIERYLEKDLGIIDGKELSEYSNCFIDGLVEDIKMSVSHVEIKIKSAPIRLHQTISGDLLISSDGRLSGKLIFSQIKKIFVENGSQPARWQQQGTVSAFEISDHLCKVSMEWDRYRKTSLEIVSDQIWWNQRESF